MSVRGKRQFSSSQYPDLLRQPSGHSSNQHRTVQRPGHPAGHLALYIAKVRIESGFMCIPGAQLHKGITLPLLYSYIETDGQCAQNVTMRPFRAITVAVEKQSVLHIVSVCFQPQVSSMHCACAVLYCRLWPLRLYIVFPHSLINGSIFEKQNFIGHKMCFQIFCVNFVSTFLMVSRIERDMIKSLEYMTRKLIDACELWGLKLNVKKN